MLKIGDRVNNFSLKDDKNRDISLTDFKGKKIVLYFYPRDNTPGCTIEACEFRDAYDRILEKGAVVLGISTDSISSHEKFKSKFQLPFYLLSDPDKKVMEQFGAWGEKKLYGKTSMGVLRSTFIINEEGIITKAFPKVTPSGHANEILEALN